MISKIFKRKDIKPTPQPHELWTEVTTEQQETMKGGYPWPGFPPQWPGGGGFNITGSSKP